MKRLVIFFVLTVIIFLPLVLFFGGAIIILAYHIKIGVLCMIVGFILMLKGTVGLSAGYGSH